MHTHQQSKRMILNGINVQLEMIGLLLVGLSAMACHKMLKESKDTDLQNISLVVCCYVVFNEYL